MHGFEVLSSGRDICTGLGDNADHLDWTKKEDQRRSTRGMFVVVRVSGGKHGEGWSSVY